VKPDRSQANDNDARVIPFRRSVAGSRWKRWPPKPAAPPLEDLGRYEGAEREDNYRHRMMMNLAALAFTLVLSMVGVWLVSQIADMRKNQDCVLSGRRNCTPVDINALER
jgi:hypothetical protein